MDITDTDYETLREHVRDEFAWIHAWLEEHPNHIHLQNHVNRLHSYAGYAGEHEDAQRGIVRTEDGGGPKPPPTGP